MEEFPKCFLHENRLILREQARRSLKTEDSWPPLWREVCFRGLISARSHASRVDLFTKEPDTHSSNLNASQLSCIEMFACNIM